MDEPLAGEPVKSAELKWQDGVPASVRFDDPYYSREDGLAESRYVFLAQNALAERFAARASEAGASFRIGETGFGTGLNFLCAWQLRDQIAPGLRLHYVAVEKYPLQRADLAQALAHWPELAAQASLLLHAYPSLTCGWHRLNFNAARITLDLFIGDVLAALNDLSASLDAWLLDGFAPAKNPAMWAPDVLTRIAARSTRGTTFATFTAAAAVREGLTAAGFEVARVQGFGRKRHMLRGTLPADAPTSASLPSDSQSSPTPTKAKAWFRRPAAITAPARRAAVIGAGLAGCAAAYSLAQRGWQVSVIERHPEPAREASGNAQGILYQKIAAAPALASDFQRAGLLYSLQQIPRLLADDRQHWQACGVLQLAADAEELTRQRQSLQVHALPRELVRAVSAEAASEIAGLELNTPGLFFPTAGWVAIPALCAALLAQPNIRLLNGKEVTRLERLEGSGWQLHEAESGSILEADLVILANASSALRFAQSAFLPLKAIRGQTTSIPLAAGPSLRSVVCGKAYIAPPLHGRYHLGATYDLHNKAPECRLEDHWANLARIEELVPALAPVLQAARAAPECIEGRVGFRCTTPDYLPIVGPLPDAEAFQHDYAGLRRDARRPIEHAPVYQPRLYVSLGHGSKGLTSCLLAGELLASLIEGESLPLAKPLAEAVHPARFLIRDLIRGRR